MRTVLRCCVPLLLVMSMVSSWGIMRQQFPSSILEMKAGIDPGQPLYLTPYIEKGDFDTAKKLSLVGPLNGTSVKSYSGFLTVNKKYQSNMFFWFFPAQADPAKAPVLLWLQGGPGGTSMFGLFVENGPFRVDPSLNLIPSEFSWNKKYSMLYIDNPVGTGFSFTKDDAGYARNETDVAVNLCSALEQFFTLFSEYASNDFYITGESYAGKYLPALAHYIHDKAVPRKIKLRGMAIGDGFTDPLTMFPAYADFMFNIGLLDEKQTAYFQSKVNDIVSCIKSGQWEKGFQLWDVLMNGDLTQGQSFFYNATGISDYYNYQRTQPPPEYQYFTQYLALPEVRKSIHVGSLPFQPGNVVEKHLMEDILQSVKPWLAEAMNYYKVLLYTGQLDIIVALPLTEAMLQTTPWQYLDEYKQVGRTVWKVRPNDTEVAGYVRRVHDFYQVLVRGGGHILPFDQPERSFDMIDRFISGRPFSE